MSIKKIILSAFAVTALGSAVMAQGGQPNQTPQPNDGNRPKMERGGKMRGEGRMGKRDGMRGMGKMRMGGMRGGMGFSDADIARLNLSDAQKVKLFDFKKQMSQERETMRNQRQGQQMTDVQREEMRKLMEARRFGTLTAEQQTRINQIEAERKSMMEQRRQKMEANRQAFLNIFTPEQRTQLQRFENERRQTRQEMRQNRRGKPAAPAAVQNN